MQMSTENREVVDKLFDQSILQRAEIPDLEDIDPVGTDGDTIILNLQPEHWMDHTDQLKITYYIQNSGFHMVIDIEVDGDFLYSGLEVTEERKEFIYELRTWIGRRKHEKIDKRQEDKYNALKAALLNSEDEGNSNSDNNHNLRDAA